MNDYCIAGLPVRMQCHYPRTQTQSEAYRAPFCSGTPIIIDISLETLINYSQNHPSLSPEGWEYMMTGKIFYHHLTEHQGLMLHASAVVVDGWAYLFSADSGTGKSTHTSQWLDYFGDRAFILNDDKPAIRRINGSYQVFGTPWSGKTGQNVNTAAPLAGIAFLERSQNNWITPMTPGEAFHAPAQHPAYGMPPKYSRGSPDSYLSLPYGLYHQPGSSRDCLYGYETQ